jgi:DNA-binding NtrC family response regulator
VAARLHVVQAPEQVQADAMRGSETLLIVEDEEALRRATVEFLTLSGYKVLEARNGLDALSVVKGHTSALDLAITDVVMPFMSGGQLAQELKTIRPETRVLFVSGYTGQTVMNHKADVENNFLQKPFTLNQLAKRVRTLLDGTKVEVPGAASVKPSHEVMATSVSVSHP